METVVFIHQNLAVARSGDKNEMRLGGGMSKALFWLRSVIVVSVGTLIYGCGNAQNGAPQGSSITFDPTSYTVYPLDPASTCFWSRPDQPFRVRVLNKEGNFLNDILLTITVNGSTTVLYDDLNNDGKLEGDELTPLTGQTTYVTTTGAFGTKIVFASFYIGGTNCNNGKGLNYEDSIDAYSGAASGKATITAKSAL